MDFSVNNKTKKTNNINFQGVKGAFDKLTNQQVFQFIPPMLKKGEKAILQVVFLEKDSFTGQFKQPSEDKIFNQEFSEKTLDLLQEAFKTNAQHGAFAYRYKIVNGNETRYAVDEARKISIQGKNNEFMNVIDMGQSYGVTPKGGAMRHSFLDSDGVLNKEGNALYQDPEFIRNHFNKLGGNIRGLNYLLENTDVLNPYRYIITTPDIGVDPISSHKYWPCNQYQCTDIDAFKEFNFNLFKKGKGYVADGAFTSQGIQSPIVHHVLKWGEDSPFYNMLKVNGRLELGVLPDRGPANPNGDYGHLGVKIVNSPKQEGYDSKKPTYMQFFDDRLSSEAQRKENALISAYDSRPEDHYEIVNHQDSVQPYYFELDLDKDASKIAQFGDKRTIMLNDIQGNLGEFLTFANYSIVSKQDAKGATYWAGNRDIIKMNLSNPSSLENRQGLKDAREYLYGVASFWSETIQSELILKTALAKDSVKKEIAKANNIDDDLINNLFKKDSDILSDMTYMVLEQNKTAQNYVEEFPLQSIETSLDLSAVFAQPQFKKEFLSGKTNENLTQMTESAIRNAVPEKYKDNEEYIAFATKTYANTILKYILAGAINPDVVKNGSIDYGKLKNINLKSFQSFGTPSTVEEERRQVISKIKSGIKPELANDISKKIKADLSKISLEDFKRAELIVEQGKGGLNWRFDAAKDIGDLDSIGLNSRPTFAEIWEGDDTTEGVVQFWGNFIENIHKYNPASYIISEITNLWDFCDKAGYPRESFDTSIANLQYGRLTDELPYNKEMQFMERTNSTTSSNYNNYYNNLMQFIGVNPEHGNTQGGENNKGNLEALKGQVDKIIDNAQPNTIILTHMFTDNHDKPRLLHAIPLDRDLYLRGTLDGYWFNDLNQMKDLLGSDFDFEDAKYISSKAYAVGIFMRDAINNSGYDDDKKAKLMTSLRNLVLGKKDNSSSADFRRAEAFGTLPYEVTIKDMFQKAGYKNEKEIEEFTWNIIKDSAWKEERLTQVMNALVGVPTLYNGAEYAQTGFESPSKNMFVGNRGQILHESIKGSSKVSKERKDYYNKVSANMAMSQLPGLSALRDGYTMSLKLSGGNSDKSYDLKGVHPGAFQYFVSQISGKDTTELRKALDAPVGIRNSAISKELTALGINNDNDNHANFIKIANTVLEATADAKTPPTSVPVWPIYKYDEKGSKVISIVSSINLNGGIGEVKNVPSIKLKTREGICPIEEGTEFARVIYKPETGSYVNDDTVSYIIKNGSLVNKQDGNPVALNDTVTTFYAKKPTQANPAFMGSLYNQTK